MHGFHGRILHIDADRRSFTVEKPADSLYTAVLGGKGLALQLLLRDNPAGADPLGPENRLIFAGGPLSGSPILGSCRHGVFTKSPLTGFLSESYAGGTVAEYLSATGFDAVVIRGASERPVWLEVEESGARFHPSEDLQGRDTYATEEAVKEQVGRIHPEVKKCGVMCIGPAGENRVRFAVIENDYWRSAGRTGVGAVMGAKGIKAVAFHGSRKKTPADAAALTAFTRQFAAAQKENPGVLAYKNSGTPMLVDIMNQAGGFPTRYWQKGRSDHWKQINAAALHERCEVRPHACLKCFMACGRLSTVKSGRHAGLKIEGPEYETIYAFGGLCEVGAIEEIAYLNDLCDRLGLDTITAGNLAGLTIEAVRQGRCDLDIDYGAVDRIALLLQDIAYRRGIGEILARGICFAARHWKMEDQAIHVKGLEPAGYDPRVLKGMGLAYGSSDRGACHLRATFYKPELAGLVDPEQIAGKAAIFTEWEDRLTIFDTLILCRFYRDLYQWSELAAIIEAAVGIPLDTAAMRRIAARVTDSARRFNLREGLKPEDDRLPARFHREALPETGKRISEDQMALMLKEYYQARGWDANGEPPPDGGMPIA
jgi:aldehyde:ferredoxin oxidoreductase